MFGEWVKRQREARGWSQSYVARRAVLTPQAINQLESGKNKQAKTEALVALAQLFGVSLNEVLIAAGLSPSSEPDELTDLLARGRALGWSRALLDAIERQAQTGQMPESERRALLRDLRADIEDAEGRAGARAPAFPAPPEAQPRPRQARLGGTEPTTEAHAAQADQSYGYSAARIDERARGVSESRPVGYFVGEIGR